jgi:hypothetical protein
MSFLDVMLLVETDSNLFARELFDFVMWDNLYYLSNTFFFSQALYYTDYQDFFIVVLYHSPELTLALNDFTNSY